MIGDCAFRFSKLLPLGKVGAPPCLDCLPATKDPSARRGRTGSPHTWGAAPPTGFNVTSSSPFPSSFFDGWVAGGLGALPSPLPLHPAPPPGLLGGEQAGLSSRARVSLPRMTLPPPFSFKSSLWLVLPGRFTAALNKTAATRSLPQRSGSPSHLLLWHLSSDPLGLFLVDCLNMK